MKGTSMASPHGAAAAAMIWAKAPGLTNKQIRYILNITARNLGLPKTQQGNGLIRLNKALAMAKDVEENRVFEILDWTVDEEAVTVEMELSLKAVPGTEIQVLCALYGDDGRMSVLRSYEAEVTEYGQSLTATLPWDPLRTPDAFKAFMTDGQFRPLGSCFLRTLP